MRALVAVAALALAGCDCGGKEPPPPTVAPAPPTPAALPPHLDEALPRTPDGLPILVQSGAGLPTGLALSLAYDATLVDPIALWGQCLSRIASCYRSNEGAISGCIDLVEVCADDAGGEGCCPAACIDGFRALRAAGVAEDDAVDQSFVDGRCVPGFGVES